MASFGEKLRRERESHQTTLEQLAQTTKIRLSYLEALEKNDFDSLPGRAFGKFYIRAYAEVLGFDPTVLIDAYDDERADRPEEVAEAEAAEPKNPWQEALRKSREDARRSRRGEAEPEVPAEEPAVQEAVVEEPAAEEPAAEDAPVEVVAARQPSREIPPWLPVAGIGFLILAVWFSLTLLRSPAAETGPSEPAAETIETATIPLVPVVQSEEPPAAEPDPDPIPETPPAEPHAAAGEGSLTVTESGVGRRVSNRRLVGSGDRFEEGAVVVFATLVLGGGSDESIRHVWFRDGKWMQTIELQLGGTHWRTHSSKTLWGVGEWTVEARDAGGRVIALAAFDCVAPGG